MSTTRNSWIAAHSYLEPLSHWTDRVEDAALWIGEPPTLVPDWKRYEDDFHEGLPLLQSRETRIDLEPAGRMTVALAERLAATPPPGGPSAELAALAAELRRDENAPRRIAEILLGDGPNTSFPGLLRYLAWTAARRHLAPLLGSFAAWRNEEKEEKWLRPYCPACGSGPAMAQLVGKDPGRRRMLVCGGCGTRWQFPRTQCPFCANDSQRLSVLAIVGEGGLRIDWCESCRGYLKTYDGEGREDLLLSDWTSLHLDVLARDRGFERRAASLYELDAGPGPDAASSMRVNQVGSSDFG